ncbi:endospore germination permease [Paenibacillus senegalensis]|uniref:endospore germination permease n=1 Tax=Paenibacillus senegalensis TaxID=1465766 RepID=UPI000287C458|nr:endospore germination permease [Paenibacillus senegalensis]
MNNAKEITILQTLFLIITAVGFSNHVTIIPMLLQAGLRDSWLSVLLTYLILNVWLIIPFYISKKIGKQSMYEWLKSHYSRWLAYFFVGLVAIYMLSIAAITIKETTTWVAITYLPYTPDIVIALGLILICIFIAGSGLQSLAITAGILLPVVWLLGYFVMSANFLYKDYSRLLPVLAEGAGPVMHTMLYAGGGFIELILVLFINHSISRPMRMIHWLILAFIITGLTLGPLMGAIATYGPIEAANQRYPAFEQWRLVVVGKYIAHVDFFALYQWLSGALIRIGLALFIILDLIRPKNRKSKLVSLLLLTFF